MSARDMGGGSVYFLPPQVIGIGWVVIVRSLDFAARKGQVRESEKGKTFLCEHVCRM